MDSVVLITLISNYQPLFAIPKLFLLCETFFLTLKIKKFILNRLLIKKGDEHLKPKVKKPHITVEPDIHVWLKQLAAQSGTDGKIHDVADSVLRPFYLRSKEQAVQS